MPDQKTVLFNVGSVAHPDDYDDATIEAVRIDTGERRVVMQGGRMPHYVRSWAGECGNHRMGPINPPCGSTVTKLVALPKRDLLDFGFRVSSIGIDSTAAERHIADET